MLAEAEEEKGRDVPAEEGVVHRTSPRDTQSAPGCIDEEDRIDLPVHRIYDAQLIPAVFAGGARAE